MDIKRRERFWEGVRSALDDEEHCEDKFVNFSTERSSQQKLKTWLRQNYLGLDFVERTTHDMDTNNSRFNFMIVEIFYLILNIIACVAFVYEIDNEEGKEPLVEWILTIVFSIDYIIRCYAHKNVFYDYVFTFYGTVDFVSILPLWIEIIFQVSSFGLGFVRCIRVLRIAKIFRQLSMLNIDTMSLHVGQTLFVIFTLIFVS
eukprot:UN32958